MAESTGPRRHGAGGERLPRTLGEATHRYLAAHGAGDWSTSTKRSHRCWLGRFEAFIRARYGEDRPLDALGAVDIGAFRRSYSEQGLRPRTLNNALYPVGALFAQAISWGVLSQNPAEEVQPLRRDEPLAEQVTAQDLELLLRSSKREPRPERRTMMVALLSLLFSTAMRLHELVEVRVEDLDLAEGAVRVRGSRQPGAPLRRAVRGQWDRPDRKVFLPAAGVAALQDWLSVRPAASHPYLFTSMRGTRLKPDTAATILGQVKALAGLGNRRHIGYESIRRTMALRLREQGTDLATIGYLLGHQNLRTTARYLRLSEADTANTAALTLLEDELLGDET